LDFPLSDLTRLDPEPVVRFCQRKAFHFLQGQPPDGSMIPGACGSGDDETRDRGRPCRCRERAG